MFDTANSESVTANSQSGSDVLCGCNGPTKVVRAWTHRNPGRRFYCCKGRRGPNGFVSCGFVGWYDTEEPNGWQFIALLEAKEIIQGQKAEIEKLRKTVRTPTQNSDILGSSAALVDKLKERNELLEREVLVLRERSLVLRNVLVASSVGLVVMVGGVMAMWKC